MQQHALVFYNLYFTSMDKPHTMNAYSCVKKKNKTKTEQDSSLSTKPLKLFLAASSAAL